METNQKMAVVGSGLVAAGVGLGVLGAALIVPAVFAWGVRLLEGKAEGMSARLEGASRRIGTAAGTLQRSFNAARKAGLEELRRSA